MKNIKDLFDPETYTEKIKELAGKTTEIVTDLTSKLAGCFSSFGKGASDAFSLLCKSQGAEPSILRFLFIFFVSPSFLPYEDKNSPPAISCSFISKLVTVMPFQSKNRTLLLATDRF